ncbi:MAG: hypothetical protein HY527_11430 [Betaproteobacteria bacterium]|nr:hypothetical protein [Betaproteobacteria bacterium]
MALTVYGFHDRPHDFAVTKVAAPLEECVFLLDFSRPLQKIRWLGVTNRWLGITVALMVPVVHQGEEKGEFVMGISRGEPYFHDLPKLWREHRGAVRTMKSERVGGLELIAAFGTHFPENY